MKYICSVCGYIYDEAREKVPFSELPDSWKCPVCKAAKSVFVPEKKKEEPRKAMGFIVVSIGEGMNEIFRELGVDYIIEGGYDPVYGARPLKRFVQKNVETLTARLILSGDVRADDRIIIDLENGQLTAHAVSVQDTAAS